MTRITIKEDLQLWFCEEEVVDSPRMNVERTVDGRNVTIMKDADGRVQSISVVRE